jgi:hypothetical protein
MQQRKSNAMTKLSNDIAKRRASKLAKKNARVPNKTETFDVKATTVARFKSVRDLIQNARALQDAADKANKKVAGVYPLFAVQCVSDFGVAFLSKSGKAYETFKTAFQSLCDALAVQPATRYTYLARVLAIATQWAEIHRKDAMRAFKKGLTTKQREGFDKRAKLNPNKKKESEPFDPLTDHKKKATLLVAQLYGRAYKYEKATEKDAQACGTWGMLREELAQLVLDMQPGFDVSKYEKA